jgi:hypothetical protein
MRFVKMMFVMLCVRGRPIQNAPTSGSVVKSAAVNASPLRAKSFKPNAQLLSIRISRNWQISAIYFDR